MEQAIKKADVLVEALPYIKKFRGNTFVIKYGGSILSEESIRRSVLEDLVFLYFMGINVVLVHGGGPNISNRLKEENIEPKFHEGIRVTDEKTLKIVQEELGELNRMLEDEIGAHSTIAVGIEGKDDFIFAKKKQASADLGFVGEVVGINTECMNTLLNENHIVILCPTGVDKDTGDIYNINADDVASYLAGALRADKFVLLTNVKGIMRNPEDESTLISSVSEENIKKLIEDEIIKGGMIPKVNAGINALDNGVKKAHIVDARIPHALLLEIFTDKGIGTEITP